MNKVLFLSLVLCAASAWAAGSGVVGENLLWHEHMIEPIGYFFVPVFFVLTGMQVDRITPPMLTWLLKRSPAD